MWSVIAAGAAACFYSAYRLWSAPTAQLNWEFLLLAGLTIIAGHRLNIRIPNGNGEILISDTFIFLTMLLYGGEAAILLAGVEAFCSSSRYNRKPITLLLAGAVAAGATFITVWTLSVCFGSIVYLPRQAFSATFILVLGVMALVQYIVNTTLIAVAVGLKKNQSIWHTWSKYYLWTSITFLAGAAVAGITAKLIVATGFYAVFVTTPIIAIVYYTYLMYQKTVEASIAQAVQAQKHVEELSHYIAEQERLREQFMQLEKAAALGGLASGVAHNVNNNLAAILGRAQLMLRKTSAPEMQHDLNIITKAAQDGANTVKRIQDFAKQRRDHDLVPTAVEQVLIDVKEFTRPRWKDLPEASNVHINFNLHIRSKAIVRGDASELRDVLVNMVFNSVDAMPAGGWLTLIVEEVNERVEISVSDTGTGMSAEVRSRIFDPFFTTKGTAGMGMGLAVSYSIIRRHEGTIEVETDVGRGTTFRIKLPVAESSASPQTATEVGNQLTLPPAPSAPPRILVVDDEDYMREVLREILEAAGYKVILAANGSEALRLFDAGSFDAVFTDVGMPGMSGWELARAIRERDNSVPLTIITGWGETIGSDKQKAMQIDWVVTKPFDIAAITIIALEISKRREAIAKSKSLSVGA